MRDIHEPVGGRKKSLTNGLNIGLPLCTLVKKTVYGVETHWPSSEEKILSTVVSKEGHADSDFLGNGTIVNFLGKIHFFWWMTFLHV